jgi:hypothetical protein
MIAVKQERQIVETSAAAIASALPFRAPRPVRAEPLPEVNQNSPPRRPQKPLFVGLCTFRI